jgi:AmmeMemoRadiSam system protein B
MGSDVSVYPGEAWESPYGEVEIDRELRDRVLDHPLAEPDESAHLYEHSLEVQLPFLFKYAERPFKILPIVLGFLDYDRARDFGRFLGSILREGALVVISSDMSHYIPAEEARRKDEILISAMERLQTDELYLKRVQYNITMCGFIPAVVGIEAGKVLGVRGGILIDYSHSGEVTGDHDRVVAYAGMVFV